jgi:hypothetical protein
MKAMTEKRGIGFSSRTIGWAGLLFLAITIIGGCAGFQTYRLESRPLAHEITVDGKDDDWHGNLYVNMEGQYSLGFVNDQQNLYVCLVVTDPYKRAQILRGGLTLWFDPKGGQEKTFGIKFPMGMQAGPRPTRPEGRPETQPQMEPEEESGQEVSSESWTEFAIITSKNQMPLLCHVGPEYSFPEGIRERERDNFRFLDKPLEYGVTVIAAHCATPVFPIDKDETKEFGAFMRSANSGSKIRLWGDTSAFSLLTRIPILKEILETFPPEWLVHGSDFPIPIERWAHLPGLTHDITFEEYKKMKSTPNPLDRDVIIKKAHGFSDSVFENADKLLRLPNRGPK